MKKIKVLNLYAGIGGNRKLWTDVEVTAIENNKEIAAIYQDFFPEDQVIVTDAHQYLLENYDKFDFIWSSPPCPSHSITNNFLHYQGKRRYPDMSLWQEIFYLHKFSKGKWIVENVKSYYPAYKPEKVKFQEIDRYYYWSNFLIPKIKVTRSFNIANARATTRENWNTHLKSLEEYHDFDLSKYNIKDKRKILRNCVHFSMGLHIFNCAFKEKQKVLQ